MKSWKNLEEEENNSFNEIFFFYKKNISLNNYELNFDK